jgi:hypothetical protein
MVRKPAKDLMDVERCVAKLTHAASKVLYRVHRTAHLPRITVSGASYPITSSQNSVRKSELWHRNFRC